MGNEATTSLLGVDPTPPEYYKFAREAAEVFSRDESLRTYKRGERFESGSLVAVRLADRPVELLVLKVADDFRPFVYIPRLY